MIEPQLTCPDGVIYNDAVHSYTIDGLLAPGCSSILKVVDPDAYQFVEAEVLERAATRGRNGHAMIALDVRNELDLSSLPEEHEGHYIAWQKFCFDFGFVPTHSERVVCSRKYRYCGTIDLVGQLLKHKRIVGRWQVDIKFIAAEPKMVELQTAGYNIAASECIDGYDPNTPRGCLWIKGDTYRFIECNNPGDRAVFISARNIYDWREKNGI